MGILRHCGRLGDEMINCSKTKCSVDDFLRLRVQRVDVGVFLLITVLYCILKINNMVKSELNVLVLEL